MWLTLIGIETERIRGMKTMTIPAIIDALGLVKKEWKNTSVKSLVTSRYKKLKSVSSSSKEDFFHQIDYHTLMKASSSRDELDLIIE